MHESKHKKTNDWVNYIIVTNDLRFSYVGASNDFNRRIRAHNNEIRGGSLYTTNLAKAGYTWRPLVVITGFPDQRSALQHELSQKRKMDKYRTTNALSSPKLQGECIHKRLRILAQVQWLPTWTKLSAPAQDYALSFHWYNVEEVPPNWIHWMPEHRKGTCILGFDRFEK